MPEMIKKLARAIWHAVETLMVSADLGHTFAGAGIFLTGFQANHAVHDILGVLAVVACGHIILRIAKRKRDAADEPGTKKNDEPQRDATENATPLQEEEEDKPSA